MSQRTQRICRAQSGQARVRSRQVRQVIVCSSNLGTAHSYSSSITRIATEQWVSRSQHWVSVGIGVLWEVHKVTTTRVTSCVQSSNSGSTTRERCCLSNVDDVPITVQARCRRVETSGRSGCFSCVVHQSCIQHGSRARSHAVHVLDGSVQRSRCSIHWDVSHVENFNVAFTCVVCLVSSRQSGVQTILNESLWNTLRQCWQCASAVASCQSSHAIRTSRHSSGPHVTWGHEHLEVKNIVRVQGAAEANLHSLAVCGVSVHNVQNGHVAVLSVEIRNDQRVTNTTLRHLQRSGVSRGHLCRAVERASARNHISRCDASKAQATNHGSNAQGQNIFSHIKNSS